MRVLSLPAVRVLVMLMAGRSNGEFQMTTTKSKNLYVSDGQLYIMPTLTSDEIGEGSIFNGYTYDLGGACTTKNQVRIPPFAARRVVELIELFCPPPADPADLDRASSPDPHAPAPVLVSMAPTRTRT